MSAPLTSEQISQHFAGFVACDATPAAAIDAHGWALRRGQATLDPDDVVFRS